MADTEPAPTPEPTPKPKPSARRSTRVLATENHVTRFVIPAGVDTDGNTGEDLHVFDHLGCEVPTAQADELTVLAARNGVRLVDITPADKD